MVNRQIQEAGDNSQQLQANHMVVNYGIDEKRAREIYAEMNIQMRKDYTDEAFLIASSRVEEFEKRLLPKMEAANGALEAFADPSFQMLLVEAQRTAAATERPADYDLLSELLLHRFQKGDNRVVRAGISRAVDIVDEISDDALLGLTVLHAVTCFIPLSGDIDQGLTVLNDLFGKLFYSKLPDDNEWLDHLDILDAIRVKNDGQLLKIEDGYAKFLPGYTEVGIEKDSANFQLAIEILDEHQIPHDILVEHILNPSYVRINAPKKQTIKSYYISRNLTKDGQQISIQEAFTDAQIDAVGSIFDLYSQDSVLKQNIIDRFKEKWNTQENLTTLASWWNSIKAGFQITAVGKVLAHSNAQRCDKSLPPLD